ncbi:MAG: hypothetical protein R6V67_06380 [Spirochaetia bacterium]
MHSLVEPDYIDEDDYFGGEMNDPLIDILHIPEEHRESPGYRGGK